MDCGVSIEFKISLLLLAVISLTLLSTFSFCSLVLNSVYSERSRRVPLLSSEESREIRAKIIWLHFHVLIFSEIQRSIPRMLRNVCFLLSMSLLSESQISVDVKVCYPAYRCLWCKRENYWKTENLCCIYIIHIVYSNSIQCSSYIHYVIFMYVYWGAVQRYSVLRPHWKTVLQHQGQSTAF